MFKHLRFILPTLAALLCVAAPAFAQTATATVVWDEGDTLANVQAYQTFLKIGSAAAVQITPTCTATSSTQFPTHCTAPLAGPVPPSGTQITLTVSNASGLAASTVTQGGGPPSPSNFKITIIVTLP